MGPWHKAAEVQILHLFNTYRCIIGKINPLDLHRSIEVNKNYNTTKMQIYNKEKHTKDNTEAIHENIYFLSTFT